LKIFSSLHLENVSKSCTVDGEVIGTNFTSIINYTIMNYISNRTDNSIGFFAPWCDQGLGIQCREYYSILNKLGYKVSIFSHKPYHNLIYNKLPLQRDNSEWNYNNVHYCESLRNEIEFKDIIEYIKSIFLRCEYTSRV
jgi:hypothetical protein